MRRSPTTWPITAAKRVTGIVKLHKTLVRIIGKSGSETIRIVPGGKAARCVNADVALLVDDGKDLLSERRRMLMTEGAASSVAEGDSHERGYRCAGHRKPEDLLDHGARNGGHEARLRSTSSEPVNLADPPWTAD